MKVYNLIYRAEFDNEEFDDVWTYGKWEDAHKNLMEIVDDWENEDLFDIQILDPQTETFTKEIWEDEKYYGHYIKGTNETFFIEEKNNVVNYLYVRIEETEIQ